MNILKLISAKRVFENFLDEKMPPVVAYKIMKLVRTAETEESFYYTELQKLIEQYGKRGDDGNLLTTEDGNVPLAEDTLPECRQKVAELESVDVDAPNILFTIDELSSFAITVREMDAISAFISDDGQA